MLTCCIRMIAYSPSTAAGTPALHSNVRYCSLNGADSLKGIGRENVLSIFWNGLKMLRVSEKTGKDYSDSIISVNKVN